MGGVGICIVSAGKLLDWIHVICFAPLPLYQIRWILQKHHVVFGVQASPKH